MNEKLRDAMDQISDRYLAEAAAPVHRRHYYPYIAAVAAVLVLVLTLGVFLGPWKQEKPTPSPSGNPVLQTPMDTTGPTVPSTEELSGTTPIDPTPTTTTRPTYSGHATGTTTVLSSTTVVSTTTRPTYPGHATGPTTVSSPTTVVSTTAPPSYPTHTTVRKPSTMKPTTKPTTTRPSATTTQPNTYIVRARSGSETIIPIGRTYLQKKYQSGKWWTVGCTPLSFSSYTDDQIPALTLNGSLILDGADGINIDYNLAVFTTKDGTATTMTLDEIPTLKPGTYYIRVYAILRGEVIQGEQEYTSYHFGFRLIVPNA